jgi:2-oxo-4-hydroxy-4-carboxy-5-ureidoimidazoline decarboxylase
VNPVPVNPVLARWHALPPDEAAAEDSLLLRLPSLGCAVSGDAPICDEQSLFAAADDCWQHLPEADWLEAFRSHPRIGEKHAQNKTTAASAAWSSGQSRAR